MPAGVISSEQDKDQFGLRLISVNGSIDSQCLRTGVMPKSSDWDRLSRTVIRLQNREGYINDKPGISITELVSQARRWKYEKGIQILFVDYIQKIEGSNPSATKTEQVTEIVNALKNLARELKIPVVALAQLNRNCEQRADKRPMASDIADASAIEKEADVIMTLYRDEVYDEQTQDKGVAELGIVKNRHGPTGVIRCRYEGKYFQFKDFDNVRRLHSHG